MILLKVVETPKKVSGFVVLKQVSISEVENNEFKGMTINIQLIDKDNTESVRYVYSDKDGYYPHDNVEIPTKMMKYVNAALSILK